MKKKMQWKDFLLLQVVFLIYSFTSLTQKLASSFLPKDAGTTEELVLSGACGIAARCSRVALAAGH